MESWRSLWFVIIIMTVSYSPGLLYFLVFVKQHLISFVSIDLIGNVYARFKYEDSAQAACDALNSRWYAARPVYCELSPVTDFREACCRQHNSAEGCLRGGFCNFIHRKMPSDDLQRDLDLAVKKWRQLRGRDERSVERSPSPEPVRKRF
jgi:splicing factor U2AF 35 kDa subunit